ncbi:hypothetical protein NLG97_g9394 [Lecanicillium saksenae]|uniref:Uncharacterized protein n=1 Tax=Lecanicillium saksenae TaxID=468837 RepID=A0ACC1QHZ6_9HYPO|nr:hypothetical protein NLG97_g9394 [Lecanicillium saksenae]
MSKAVVKFLEYLLWNDFGSVDERMLERGASEESQDSGVATDQVGTRNAVFKVEGPTWDSMMRAGSVFGLQATYNVRTMRRAMGTLAYRRCLKCEQTWVNPRQRATRVEYAKVRLGQLPEVEDWKRVRFSGVLHFGFGLNGKVRLLPRPGEKYSCPACQMELDQQPQHILSGWDHDVRRVHAWAAIGYGFRSELVFYDEQTGGKSMGIVTPAIYQDVILDQHVQSWPVGEHVTTNADGDEVRRPKVVWEEDCNPHAAGGNTIDRSAEAWKDERRLHRHKGCPEAPDLCLLDVIFPLSKQWTVEPGMGDWEPATLRRAARQAWAAVDQQRVNLWVELMPQRLRQVIANEGAMMPW